MMSFLGEILKRLIGSEIEASVALVKIEAAIVSLNVIKGTRRIAMLVCLLVFSVVILACGFLMIPLALCFFMPWAPETRAIVAASFGAAYVLIPLVIVIAFFSEKRWMKASKADKLVKEALTR
jgi:hypothetical protein